MNKTLVFDMDGTIADLYGVENWLDSLNNEDVRPYVEAKPLVDMEALNLILDILKRYGWKVVVTTWLAKNASEIYNQEVRKAKIEWLKKQNFEYDEIHLIKYGTTKADSTRKKGGLQILIDDNDKIRKGWHLGNTINAKGNIIAELLKLVIEEN